MIMLPEYNRVSGDMITEETIYKDTEHEPTCIVCLQCDGDLRRVNEVITTSACSCNYDVHPECVAEWISRVGELRCVVCSAPAMATLEHSQLLCDALDKGPTRTVDYQPDVDNAVVVVAGEDVGEDADEDAGGGRNHEARNRPLHVGPQFSRYVTKCMFYVIICTLVVIVFLERRK